MGPEPQERAGGCQESGPLAAGCSVKVEGSGEAASEPAGAGVQALSAMGDLWVWHALSLPPLPFPAEAG